MSGDKPGVRADQTGGGTIPQREFCPPLTKESYMARELLLEIIEAFPQADPASEFYNEEINGCEAVNFLSQFIPQIREYLDSPLHKTSVVLEGERVIDSKGGPT